MFVGSRRGRIRGWTTVAAAAVVVAGCTETPRAGLGESCDAHDDCVAEAQCFGQVCAPRCSDHPDCGGGYVCAADGTCERVTSQIGDACQRELDCGPAQSCQLDAADHDGDGELDATCQLDQSGAVTGAACATDGDCRSKLCALGRCSEVCRLDTDCPDDTACVVIPRLLGSDAPTFRGCMQASGRLEVELPLAAPSARVRIPVPGHARSFALIAEAADDRDRVGATRVEGPQGALLYREPTSEDDYYANPIRYAPGPGISTLLVPNSPRVPLEVGAYTVELAAFRAPGVLSASVPRARVLYKLGPEQTDAAVLDLDLYFLDLADHPCAAAFPGGLDAAAAAGDAAFQDYLRGVEAALADAGIELGSITYRDVTGRPDLDAISARELPALLSESTTAAGVNVFFVRSIHPVGVQALAGGTPGTPGVAGTPASGVAVSVETLCYRSWDELARTTAHIAARQLGLFVNVSPDGRDDPIADSDRGRDNLMFFSEFGGVHLSPGQGQTLRRSPGVR